MIETVSPLVSVTGKESELSTLRILPLFTIKPSESVEKLTVPTTFVQTSDSVPIVTPDLPATIFVPVRNSPACVLGWSPAAVKLPVPSLAMLSPSDVRVAAAPPADSLVKFGGARPPGHARGKNRILIGDG